MLSVENNYRIAQIYKFVGRKRLTDSLNSLTAKAMSPALDYHELRQRFVAALEAAAGAHESGNLPAIETGYDELDAVLPRGAGWDKVAK